MSESDITPVLMPKWGLSMSEGVLVDWLVDEGAEIAVGDEIMEVETDKIASAVEAADAGILRRRVGDAGETYPVRALLGVLAPPEVSDNDIDAYIAAYEVPADEDDEEAAAAAYEFVDSAAGRLRYARRGDDGPVLVLVHGFGGDLDNWLFNIDALAEKAAGANVPYWARDMKIIVLEDMGELEAAKILVGGLIASGEITDPYELNFLQNKIRTLEEKLTKTRQDVDN